MKMDNTDIKILMELQSDSRLSIRELSKRVNLSPPSVAERIRKFEDSGVIEGYTIKINEAALGFSIQCMIQIDIKNSKFETFVDSISSLDSTTSTHIIFSEIPINKSVGKFFSDL